MSDGGYFTLAMLCNSLRAHGEGRHKLGYDPHKQGFAFLAADMLEKQAADLAAANEAREKAERERDVLRNCQFHNESELRKADAEIGNLRGEVERLREDAERYATVRAAAYVAINPHHKTSLWTLRGIYEIDGKDFDAAIDAARKGA